MDVQMSCFHRKSLKWIVLFFVLLIGARGSEMSLNFWREEVRQIFFQQDGFIEVEQKKVALTFDDGPSENPEITNRLLDELNTRGVKATFFLLGVNAEKNPETVKRIAEEGHLLGNHSYSHINIEQASDEEVIADFQKSREVIEEITGVKLEFLRPPYGIWREELEEVIGLVPVMWSVDPLDWNTDNVEKIVNKVVTDTEENDIILMHDSSESSIEAAICIIEHLTEAGFEFVTVDELLLP